MTCVAFDGTTLAADRARHFAGLVYPSDEKIVRLPNGWIAGGAGDADECSKVFAWLGKTKRARIADYPELRVEEDGSVSTAVLCIRDGEIHLYGATPYSTRILAPFFAIGSGAHLAIGAMAAGATARQAVDIAAQFDPNVGLGIVTLTAA